MQRKLWPTFCWLPTNQLRSATSKPLMPTTRLQSRCQQTICLPKLWPDHFLPMKPNNQQWRIFWIRSFGTRLLVPNILQLCKTSLHSCQWMDIGLQCYTISTTTDKSLHCRMSNMLIESSKHLQLRHKGKFCNDQ